MPDVTEWHWIDWLILVILGLSTLLSLWRGFAREAMSLAGWVAAFVVANVFVDQLASQLAGLVSNITGRYVLAYVILFAVTLMAAGVAGLFAAKLMKVTGLSVLDRVLGMAFGFARGVILILVVVFVLRQLAPPQDLQWMYESRLLPHLDMLAEWVQTVFAGISSRDWTGATT
jgi:membrane protein required for colicin V production